MVEGASAVVAWWMKEKGVMVVAVRKNAATTATVLNHPPLRHVSSICEVDNPKEVSARSMNYMALGLHIRAGGSERMGGCTTR